MPDARPVRVDRSEPGTFTDLARLTERLRARGHAAGLQGVGVAPATPFERTRRDLEQRRAAGRHGGMQFTYRNPARSCDPGRVLDGAAALVVGALAYGPEAPGAPAGVRAPAETTGPTARVARYARDDLYGRLRAALAGIADDLTAAGWRARVVADDNALVDREAAVRAGLGWYGKNSNVLLFGAGSWFVLGSVVTDAPLPADPAPAADPTADGGGAGGCGACRRCLDGCPTGAIVAPGVVDARRCLAWLVQAGGDFPVEHRVALGDRIYGCDDCQEVCPPNRRAPTVAPRPDDGRVDLLALLAADDEVLLETYGRWYIADRDPRVVRRNALLALGNTAAPSDRRARAALDRWATDTDDMLARHARWARDRLRARTGGPGDTTGVAAP